MKPKYTKEILKEGRRVITFWKPSERYGAFSQWYGSPFTDSAGQRWECAEQWMMAMKAETFCDRETWKAIIRASDPKVMKDLGRTVKGFSQEVWDRVKYDIVRTGNYLKFSQNPVLRERLLSTGDAVLAEASPYDRVWGIGATDPGSWNGENLLGFALMEVRDTIRKEKEEDTNGDA